MIRSRLSSLTRILCSEYTASLAPSVLNYPKEYGRRYHAFRPGAYPLPNDDSESERLDMTHELIVRLMGNRLFLAPLERPKVHRILDIGSGTGKCSQKFDFIICRYMAAAIKDWPKLVQSVYENLNPGGWAEFQDMDIELYSDDGTLTEQHATRDWSRTFVTTLRSMQLDPAPGPQLEGWIRQQGSFTNITHQKFKAPVGPWPKDKAYKDLGMLNLIQTLDGLEGFSLRMFCGVLGRTKQQVLDQLSDVRRELKSNAFHCHFDM
ncbi:hypothetical protein KNSL1_005199 [Colletotrichum chrysophilum]|nr:hypothetical protein KNSL1_005199 [Colletotrichum chrysophilum]